MLTLLRVVVLLLSVGAIVWGAERLNLDDKTIEAMRIVAQVGTPDEQENLRSTNGQACRSLGDPFD